MPRGWGPGGPGVRSLAGRGGAGKWDRARPVRPSLRGRVPARLRSAPGRGLQMGARGAQDAGAGQGALPRRRLPGLGLLALLQLLHAAGPVPRGDHLEAAPGGAGGGGGGGSRGSRAAFPGPLPAVFRRGLPCPSPSQLRVCWTRAHSPHLRALPSAGDSRPRELGASAHGKLSPTWVCCEGLLVCRSLLTTSSLALFLLLLWKGQTEPAKPQPFCSARCTHVVNLMPFQV